MNNFLQKMLPLAAIFFGAIFVRRDLGVDIWFMLNNGQYILAHGFPHIELFTIHENLHCIVQQWLTCIIFWKVYCAFGYEGLVMLSRIMGIVILWGYYRLCMLVSRNNRIVSVMLTALVGTVLCLVFVYPRPIIFSLPVFLAEVYILECAGAKPRLLFFLPLLSVLLTCFHAAMLPMFFVLVLPYLCASIRLPMLDNYVCTGIGSTKKILLAAIFSVLAALCNPYGIDALIYGINSYGHAAINYVVAEMHPLTINTPLSTVPVLFLLFLLPAYGRYPAPLQYVLLTILTAYMTLAALRSEALFLAFGTLGAAYVLRSGQNFDNTIAFGKILRLTLAALTVIFVGLTLFNLKNAPERHETEKYEEYYYGEIYKPAADFLLSLPQGAQKIRLLPDYNAGSYFEFRGIKCYIDSRAEIFLEKNNGQKDIFDEYAAFYKGNLPYRKFLWRYDFTHVFVTTENFPFFYAMAHDADWKLVYEFDYGRYVEAPLIGRIYERVPPAHYSQ